MQLSCSDLLRREVQTGNPRAVVIAKKMTEGHLVPASLVLDLIKVRMLATCADAKGYVIDSFPREKVQAVQFDKEVCPVTLVIYMSMEDGLQLDRCQSRRITSGRIDDSNETIESRIKHFRETSPAILKYYHEKLVTLDGAKPIETIFEYVCFQLDEMLDKLDNDK